MGVDFVGTSADNSSAFSVKKDALKPIVKWVGGKQQLLAQFKQFFPEHVNGYIEPFLGGGAVFFYLWNSGAVNDRIILLDNNEELINLYLALRDYPDELIRLLTVHQARHSREYYYKIRSADKQAEKLDSIERAARTLYLNRTCYNGLYRVNSKGQFNVPMGRYKQPRIVFKENLLAVSSAIQNVTIEVKDFRDTLHIAQPGDFIYFDPPYHPLSKSSNFTQYTADNFTEKEQRDLAELYAGLSAKGCLCMLSNSDTPLIRELYAPFRTETVYAKRAVNSKAKGRAAIKELVVLNY